MLRSPSTYTHTHTLQTHSSRNLVCSHSQSNSNTISGWKLTVNPFDHNFFMLIPRLAVCGGWETVILKAVAINYILRDGDKTILCLEPAYFGDTAE